MISANESLFDRLADAAGDSVTSALRKQKRAIKTNVEEKVWLKNLTLRSSAHLRLGSRSGLAVGDLNGSFFVVSIGIPVARPPPDFEPIKLNAGMFTAVAAQLNVPITVAPDLQERLLEYVFYPVEDGIELLEFEVLRPFFEPIEVFRIDTSSGLGLDRELGLRAGVATLLAAPVARSLDWPQPALDRLSYMVRDPEEKAPFHLLLRALTERRGDAAFLAIYRCLEQLFPVPAIAELSIELGLSEPTLRVATVIERRLGWRRREDDAIAHLFKELAPALVERMRALIGGTVQEGNESKYVAGRVYELRNRCVHYRPIHASDEALPFEAWFPLVDLMLEVVQSLYARYAVAFNQPIATGHPVLAH